MGLAQCSSNSSSPLEFEVDGNIIDVYNFNSLEIVKDLFKTQDLASLPAMSSPSMKESWLISGQFTQTSGGDCDIYLNENLDSFAVDVDTDSTCSFDASSRFKVSQDTCQISNDQLYQATAHSVDFDGEGCILNSYQVLSATYDQSAHKFSGTVTLLYEFLGSCEQSLKLPISTDPKTNLTHAPASCSLTAEVSGTIMLPTFPSIPATDDTDVEEVPSIATDETVEVGDAGDAEETLSADEEVAPSYTETPEFDSCLTTLRAASGDIAIQICSVPESITIGEEFFIPFGLKNRTSDKDREVVLQMCSMDGLTCYDLNTRNMRHVKNGIKFSFSPSTILSEDGYESGRYRFKYKVLDDSGLVEARSNWVNIQVNL